MNCCNHDCKQSDTCPIRLARQAQAQAKPTTHAQYRRQGMALPIVRIALLLYAVLALWIYFFWL